MKVKLIENPWANTELLPDGLTLGKVYEVTESFNSNCYDVYYRIIDDNGEEVAWHVDCFEKLDTIKIIETNVFEDFSSFQSRVIEVESWDYIINLFTSAEENTKPDVFDDIFNSKSTGVILPRQSRIENLQYDDFRLSCDVICYTRNKKLIQRVYEGE